MIFPYHIEDLVAVCLMADVQAGMVPNGRFWSFIKLGSAVDARDRDSSVILASVTYFIP